jgi:hypothetical protein
MEGGVLSNLIDRTECTSIALYSNGAPKDEVKRDVLKTIDSFEMGFKWSGKFLGEFPYYSVVWLVSMAILCDVDQVDFERITSVINREKIQDKLLNALIRYRQPEWQDSSTQFIQKTPYAKLNRVIDEKSEEKGIGELQNYLKEEIWYEGHKVLPWYDSHLRPKGIYFGYWSWEAAALVKVKGWNDEKLKDIEYYPYDAVHLLRYRFLSEYTSWKNSS